MKFCLSKDILNFLLYGLNLKSLYNLSLIDKKFYKLLDNNLFWMNKVLNEFGKFGHIPIKIINKHKKLYNEKINWKNYYKILQSKSLIHQNTKISLNDNKTIQTSEIIKISLNDNRTKVSDINCALRFECKQNTCLKIVEILLKDPRIDTSNYNNYCIKKASKHGYSDIVKLLLENKMTDPSVDNNFAIRNATYYNHIETIKILLNDPRVDPTVWNGKIYFDAYKNYDYKLIKILNDWSELDKLDKLNKLDKIKR